MPMPIMTPIGRPAICAVSGNAMAHVYVRNERGWAQPNGRGGIETTARAAPARASAHDIRAALLTREECFF